MLAGSVVVPLWAPARSQAWFQQRGAPTIVAARPSPPFRWQSHDG